VPDGAVVAQRDQREQPLVERRRGRGTPPQQRCRPRVERDEVRFHPGGDVADARVEPDRTRRAQRVPMPERVRRERDPAQPRDPPGGEHRAQRRERAARAHVAREPPREAGALGGGEVEQSAAEEQVRARAHRRAGARPRKAHPIGVVDVQAVREDRARTHQPQPVVDRQVASRGGKQARDPRDLVAVLGQVRLDPDVGVRARQLARARELPRRAARREARRDRAAEPAAPVPASDQRFGVRQTAFGVVAHRVRRVAIHQALAGDHSDAAARGRFEQGLRGREMGAAPDHRRGHAVARELVEEDVGLRRRVRRIREARLGGERVTLQPGQQPVGRPGDRVELHEVQVQVDEARRDHQRPPVLDGEPRVLRGERRVLARFDDRSGVDDHQRVVDALEPLAGAEAQQRRAKALHRERTRQRPGNPPWTPCT